MDPTLFLALIALVAFAYAMVGHGGASGYLALMGVLGLAPDVMRPSALLLNLCVSAIAFVQFQRAGHFRWRLFWPFAVASIPCAWLGAQIHLDPLAYKRLLAVCLLIAVARLLGAFGKGSAAVRPVPLGLALLIGAVLGLLSGMIGIGGGILLSPLLLVFHWADAKVTACTSAAFIFVNSLAGIGALIGQGVALDGTLMGWVVAAIVGGLAGSWIGASKLVELRLRQALGVVLLLASIKLWWP